MQLGYAATAKRRYHTALDYFQQAQKVRPGDKYADKAVVNIQYLLQHNRQNFAFIPPGLGRPTWRISAAPRSSPPYDHIHHDPDQAGRISAASHSSEYDYIDHDLDQGGRRSAASRSGSCVQGAQTLTAIVPEVDPQLTTAGHPTFFIYVPQNSAQALEFKLLLHDDHSGQPLYIKTLKPNTMARIVSISLPSGADGPSLEVGKEYDWNFSVVCDQQSRDKDVAVGGSVERIQPDPNLVTQLANLLPIEQADLYATSGIWMDSLDTLADLRRSQPNNSRIKTDWEELLESVGLEEKIATSPLL
jgi:hypothetical protein